MSFLAPLFLFGVLTVSLPIIFHLIRRTTRERTAFSSLMFLQPSPPRLTRRSRLEHILLLLLRCGVIGLLALGFARPFFKKPVAINPARAGARKIAVLLDTSGSMRRADLWVGARKHVEEILRAATPLDQLALFTFDRQITPRLSFDEWNNIPAGDRAALTIRKLDEINCGWGATHLGNALISAAETLADTAGKPFTGRKQIIVISDLQEGSRLDQLQGYEWPKGIEVSFETLKPRSSSNAGLQVFADSDEVDAKSAATIRARISNAPDSKGEQFQVGWAAPDGQFVGKPLDIYLPAGQNRIVSLPLPSTNTIADRITLKGDEDDFDNTCYLIPPEQARLTLAYFGADSEADPRGSLYFLRRAFHETEHQAVRIAAYTPDQPLSSDQAGAAALFVATGTLSREQATLLHEQIVGGKTLLFSMSNETSAGSLARVLGLDRLPVEEARVNNYALLVEIDFRHPLLSPFADPRFSDFSKIHFWKYRKLDAANIPAANILAKFDNGDPALLEVGIGKGRVLVLTSGWRPDDSQLALATKFVPLLYSLLEGSGAAPPRTSQFLVGDTVPLQTAVRVGREPLKVRSPGGSELNLALSETNFTQTSIPGIYTVASAQSSNRFAVNLDPSESRTAPLAPDELERLGVPMLHHPLPGGQEAARKSRVQNSELESRQKLWRIVLWFALTVVLLETWLAGRFARRAVINPELISKADSTALP